MMKFLNALELQTFSDMKLFDPQCYRPSTASGESILLKRRVEEDGSVLHIQIYFNFKVYINCPEYFYHLPQLHLGHRMSRLLAQIR